jgi:predicted membrane protein
MNMNTTQSPWSSMSPKPGFRLTPQVVLGLMIVAFGLILTADNLGYADAGHILRFWPLMLVAFGAAKFLQSDTTAGKVLGGVLVLFGVGTLSEEFIGFSFDFDRWWPLFLVGVGSLIIYRAFKGDESCAPAATGSTDSTFSEVAVWSGKVRRNTSAAFRRADLTAIMGGVEVDLRGASTGGQEAIIDVFVWWGGVEITVPPDWAVSNQVVAIMGGADDSSSGTQDSKHRLTVRGFVVMGGVEIKTK